MEFSDVFLALYQLNIWMISTLFVSWMESVDVFRICWYQWKCFFSLLINVNKKYVRFLYCLSKWIEFVNIFLIVCFYKWWWSIYCVRDLGKHRAKLCCFFQIQNLCFDLLLSLSFICIKTFSFCLYYSYSNIMVFRTMVYAAVIGFIFNSMCRFRRKTEMYYI